MNITEDQLRDLEARMRAYRGMPPLGGAKVPKARQPRTGYRSKTEAAYAQYLDVLVKIGSIESWKYEPVTLKLADGVRYQPDFMVCCYGVVEFREVKGRKGSTFYSRAIGKMKIKIAASLYPMWRFDVIFPGAKAGMWESVRIGGGE
jgi:hypothetical protein